MMADLRNGRHAYFLLIVLTAYFWLPAWWGGKLLIQGDSAHHGLPLVWLHAQALAGHDTLLWSSRIYGGHPLFAEGQGGNANPLSLLVAWLFEPVRGIAFLHWLTMAVGGSGMFCLCRILGISGWSAVFAGIAAAFSGAWLSNHHSMTEFVTLAWVPWLIAGAEYWLKQPSLVRAVWLAIPAALLIFAGYPQMAQGTVLYVLVSLLSQCFQVDTRQHFVRHWRAFLTSGSLAVLLATGLAAIQFLPLMELVEQSHRRQGIEQVMNFALPPLIYFRGLFFTYYGSDINGIAIPGLGSIAVFMLAGLCLFFRTPPRILGHLLGAFLLFNLSMGATSPLFRIAYEHHLIPGLHYFRTMLAYSPVAVVGLAVAAAHVLDTLSGAILPALREIWQRHRIWMGGLIVAYGVGLTWLCLLIYSPLYSKWSFLAPALLVLPILLSVRRVQRQWLPALAVLILIVDVLVWRAHPFTFHDRKILERPDPVNAIAAEADAGEYRTMCHSVMASGMVTIDPASSELPRAFHRALQAMTPFPTALMWGIPSINGVTALPLARRTMLDPVFLGEVIGSDTNRPGLRMMDVLGVRYFSVDGLFNVPGLTLYWQDPSQSLFIMKNDFAKPRFQVYWNAEAVDTPEQALAGLKAAKEEKLFIERHRGERALLSSAACAGDACGIAKPKIGVIEAGAMRYRVSVEMPRAGWLFLADAYYPGWEATVNGARRPLYAAQVLGKAVPLDAGHNEVTIRYVPRMFYIGATVSAITLVLALLILFGPRVMRYSGRSRRAT